MSLQAFVKHHIPRRLLLFLLTIFGSIRALFLIGNQVECPCCGHHFRRFVTFNGRYNSRCVRCDALERHRLLSLYLHACTPLYTDTLNVLQIAPDALERSLRAAPHLTYTSADLDSPLAMVHMDITTAPFPDQTFDVILCSHVLEHIPDDRKAMGELFRMLKPSGWAILLVPIQWELAETFEDATITDPKERVRLFGQFDHVRVYGRDYVTRLESAGFTVHQDAFIDQLSTEDRQRYGLETDIPANRIMFRCSKGT